MSEREYHHASRQILDGYQVSDALKLKDTLSIKDKEWCKVSSFLLGELSPMPAGDKAGYTIWALSEHNFTSYRPNPFYYYDSALYRYAFRNLDGNTLDKIAIPGLTALQDHGFLTKHETLHLAQLLASNTNVGQSQYLKLVLSILNPENINIFLKAMDENRVLNFILYHQKHSYLNQGMVPLMLQWAQVNILKIEEDMPTSWVVKLLQDYANQNNIRVEES